MQNGEGSIMVWDGICANWRTSLLVIVSRSLTALRYVREILESHVISFANNRRTNFILQYYNARPHVVRIIMEWQANRSVLNPIEHVWELEKNSYSRLESNTPGNDET